MKCKYCNGTGEHVNDANRMTTCEFCGGTGEIEVTNEEWFCQLSTIEKSEWITDQINKAVGLALHDAEMCDGDVNEDDYMNSADDWVQWLKEKHNG